MSEHLYPERPVFLVDDEQDVLDSSELALNSAGITNVLKFSDSREVVAALSAQGASVVVLDLTMPHIRGEEILESMRGEHPEVPVIVSTGHNDVDTAVQCMQSGAADYLVKPVERTRFISAVRKLLEMEELEEENQLLRDALLADEISNPEVFSGLITQNSGMHAIFKYLESIAQTGRPVLITGETGVGKEMIAKSVHVLSGRNGEFVAVNAAGLDDNLFTDTLFGHLRGAFTGADRPRQGLVELAAGGTLFLDEIGDLEIVSQVKLLRLLQEGEYFPLGSDRPHHTDARIVVATYHNLTDLIQAEQFRKDLYYRLTAHQVKIPPLRERLDDLPLLVDHIFEEAAKTLGKKKPTAPPELLTILSNYSFPGNIRELQSMIFDAVAQHKGRLLSLASFRGLIRQPGAQDQLSAESAVSGVGVSEGHDFPTLAQGEADLIREALRRTNGNRTIAADLLGINRQALIRRVKTLDL